MIQRRVWGGRGFGCGLTGREFGGEVEKREKDAAEAVGGACEATYPTDGDDQSGRSEEDPNEGHRQGRGAIRARNIYTTLE